MAVRWVINPVIVQAGVRRPKVATLIDPGRTVLVDGIPTPKSYRHSSCIGSTGNWCLSFVRGVDMTPLDADPEIINVLEEDMPDDAPTLDQSPRSKNWDLAKTDRIKTLLATRGAPVSDLEATTPLWIWIERLGRQIRPEFQPRGTWVR